MNTRGFEQPPLRLFPEGHRDQVERLFARWGSVMSRNRELTRYYDMKNRIKDLGISIPQSFLHVNSVVGWCRKAVSARTVRSRFDGFVFHGRTDPELDRLVRANDLRSLYRQAVQCALVHGVSAMTVMRGTGSQPAAKVRVFSANRFCCLWNDLYDRIDCGVVLHGTDPSGAATSYVFYFDDCVVKASAEKVGDEYAWSAETAPNPMGRPLMELFINEQSPDHPLGRSLITPELMGIVDKAMRDVLRMDIGAEFFTFPQRYVLGAADDLFAAPLDPDQPVDEDGDPIDADGNKIPRVSSDFEKLKTYVGSFLALTRDENGDMPQVGQFSPADPASFAAVFENDAQRFSGATNVPLGQLGVLSNTYTSSDALGAANDPLIMEVEQLTDGFRETMAEVGRMMIAVSRGVPVSELTDDEAGVEAYFPDPSMPTIAARADAWTKLAAADASIIGTDVYYEGVGLSRQTIARLESEKGRASAISTMRQLAVQLTKGAPASTPTESVEGERGPEEGQEA